MAVFRVERTGDYTVMSNFHLKDKRLSLKAKGLLSQMLSLPDDWDYFETTLIDRRIRIITSSFEAWYQKQTHYVKISERSNENGIYREA